MHELICLVLILSISTNLWNVQIVTGQYKLYTVTVDYSLSLDVNGFFTLTQMNSLIAQMALKLLVCMVHMIAFNHRYNRE